MENQSVQQKAIRVLLADMHQNMLEGIRSLLETVIDVVLWWLMRNRSLIPLGKSNLGLKNIAKRYLSFTHRQSIVRKSSFVNRF